MMLEDCFGIPVGYPLPAAVVLGKFEIIFVFQRGFPENKGGL